MVEAVVYMGFHQDVRVRLASGALVRCDVPNDGSRGGALLGRSGVACTCRPSACACSRRTTVRRREELVTAARRVIGRDGFAGATVGDDHARGGRFARAC